MKELKIVAVDDSALVREHLQELFSNLSGIKLVGTAKDGDEGLSVIREVNPDVVLLDISMPRKNGIELLQEIREENDQVTIIMFTMVLSADVKEFCLRAGANYCFSKTQFSEILDICHKLKDR